MLPLINLIVADMQVWLGDPAGVTISVNLDKIPAIVEKRQTLWQMAEASTVLTVNEKRDAMGYEPVKGGDVILVPSGMISLSDAVSPLSGFSTDPVDQKALRRAAGYED